MRIYLGGHVIVSLHSGLLICGMVSLTLIHSIHLQDQRNNYYDTVCLILNLTVLASLKSIRLMKACHLQRIIYICLRPTYLFKKFTCKASWEE